MLEVLFHGAELLLLVRLSVDVDVDVADVADVADVQDVEADAADVQDVEADVADVQDAEADVADVADVAEAEKLKLKRKSKF